MIQSDSRKIPHVKPEFDAQPPRIRSLCIIDDDETDRRRVLDHISGGPYRVHIFHSGKDFLAEAMPLKDMCVLLDVWMPEIDGLKVLHHIVQIAPECPIIMLSGKSTLPIAVEAMKRGAIDFLEKPIAKEALLTAIGRADTLWSEKASSAVTRGELLNKITRREGEVLQLLVQGHPNKVVAFRLGIADNTVEVHRQRLMRRLNVKTFAELMRLAVNAGI
jgi:two-component system response regulator FixJ